MASCKTTDPATEMRVARSALEAKWDEAFDSDGIFNYVFGDPQTNGAAVRVTVSWENDTEPVVDLEHPVSGSTLQPLLEKLELKQMEGVVWELANKYLSRSDVVRFAKGVYDHLSGAFPSEDSFVDPAYAAWQQSVSRLEQHVLETSISSLKQSNSAIGGGLTLAALAQAEENARNLATRYASGGGSASAASSSSGAKVSAKESAQRKKKKAGQKNAQGVPLAWIETQNRLAAEEAEQRRLHQELMEAARREERRQAEARRQQEMMRLRAERLEQERLEKAHRTNIRLANREAQQAIVLAREREETEELAAQLRDARTEMYSTNNWPKPETGMYSTDFITYLETVFMLKSHMIQWTNAGLNTIPDLVGHFDWIQELNLSNNNLKLIPIFIFTLPNIRKLYLHHNKIKRIPSFASHQWAELQLLDLHNNSLRELPDLSHCKNLTTLDCERNFLKTFPEGIGECEKLYHLNLRHNQIKLIPGVLGVFATRKLSYLNLRNNPIVNLPPHVYQKGMKATMDFLNEHSSGDMMARIEPREGLAKSLLSLISQPNPLLADVTLTAKDGTSYPAHAIVLFARCTVLKERIEKMDFSHLSKPSHEALPAIPVPSLSGYNVSIEPLVDLQPINPAASSHLRVIQLDISSDELRSLLHYLYGDVYVCPSLNLLAVDLSMTPEQISELSHANDQLTKAHRKQMDDLVAVANKFRLPHWKMLIEQAFGIKTTVAVESDWVPQMRAIWSSSHLFDVSFNCSEGRSCPLIDAHRVIIASRSQFLRALLAGHMVEAKQRIVTLPEVSHTVMKAIVEFCYTEDVETLDPETVIELLTTAKVYGLKKLQNLVESVVGYSLDVDNVSSILTIAWTHAMPQLARACKFFVISNWNSVTAGPDWKSIDPAVREKLHQTAVKWKVTPALKK